MGKYMYDFRLRKNFLNKRQKHNFEGKDKYNFTILKKNTLAYTGIWKNKFMDTENRLVGGRLSEMYEGVKGTNFQLQDK